MSKTKTDQRAAPLREALLLEWRRAKAASPAAQLAFVTTAEGFTLHGARTCHQLRKQLEHLRRRLSQETPSGTWLDDAWGKGVVFPFPAERTPMVRSRSNGVWKIHTERGRKKLVFRGRFTPPQCRGEEDDIDCLSVKRAIELSMHWPTSISALSIIQIGAYKGREQRRRLYGG